MPHKPFQTPPFEKKMNKQDKPVRERIKKDITEKLCDDPYRNSTPLTADLWGFRSFHSGKYRVVFLIVEEVKKNGLENTRPEFNCEGLPDDGIKLIDVGPRKNVYD